MDEPQGKAVMSSASLLLPSSEFKGRSLWQDAWSRLRRNRLAVVCMVLLACITAACFIGPFMVPWNPRVTNLKLKAVPPGTTETLSREDFLRHRFANDTDYEKALKIDTATPAKTTLTHWLGTDTLGRDLLARILTGGQVSLMVGIIATLVALIIGVGYGATAGYVGGRGDAAMMRAVDILNALPFLIFVILLTTMLGEWAEERFGNSLPLIYAAIGAVEWLTMARIVRAQVQGLVKQEFVDAARSLGLPPNRIIFRHIIPNVLGPVIVFATLTVPAVMLLEASLSFLGLGVRPPDSSWGTLIDDGATNMETSWWMLAYPASLFSLTLFCLNFAGDGLRDALDVKSSKD